MEQKRKASATDFDDGEEAPVMPPAKRSKASKKVAPREHEAVEEGEEGGESEAITMEAKPKLSLKLKAKSSRTAK